MLNFLNKPYPFNDDLKYNAKIIFFISIGVLAFFLVFQPIDIRQFTNKEIFYLVSGIAASTFIVLSFSLLLLPSFFPKLFESKSWNIKKEIVWNIWIVLAISASHFLFYSLLFGLLHIHLMDVGRIVVLGFISVSVLITINQNRLLRSHLKTAQKLNKKLEEGKHKKEKLVHFLSEYKKDELTLKSDSIVLIKSSDNYIEVYYLSDGKIVKQMIRSTLKKAEELLSEFDFIIRCHRTFIININHIKEIQGNSQGYKLYFNQIDFPAIVSQKYINEFNILVKKA